MFDSSSTVYQAAKHVVEKGLPLTAVTNDVNIATVLAKSRLIKFQVLGGTQRPGS
ncbi:hypothetical protein KA005_75510 [bacterium]|nr:hypothetical protein [bacterium]